MSLRAEVPEALLAAIRSFIERHPHWDQYRLFQAALAGFLVQNGVRDRGVTRCYLANLFPGQARFAAPAATAPIASPSPAATTTNTAGDPVAGEPFRLRDTPLQERTKAVEADGPGSPARRSDRILLRRSAGRRAPLRRVA